MLWGSAERKPRSGRTQRHHGRVIPSLPWLICLVLVSVLALTSVDVWHLKTDRTNRQEEALLEQLRAQTKSIDREFSRIETALSALAASSALELRDFTRFEREMRVISMQLGSVSIGLVGAGGNQILATSWAVGERRTETRTWTAALTALAENRTIITGMGKNPATGEREIDVAVPVFPHREAHPDYVVTAAMPVALVARLNEDGLTVPDHHVIGTLLDQDGIIVAHPFDARDVVGEKIRGSLLEIFRGAPDGFVRDGAMIDGKKVLLAFAKSPSSGYMVAAGIPDDVFNAPVWPAVMPTVVWGTLLLGAAALGTGLLARRLQPLAKWRARVRSRQSAPIGSREIDARFPFGAEEQESARSTMAYRQTLRAVMHSSADAIFMLDPQGIVTYANAASERMFGWRQDELIGRTLQHLVDGERSSGSASPANERTLTRIVAAGQAADREQDLLSSRDGQRIAVEFDFIPIVADGVTAGAVLTVRDVGVRRRHDLALRAHEARSGDLLGVLDPAKILVRDMNGTIRFWSKGCERLYGWSSDEAVGRPIATLLQTVFPAPAEEIDAELLRDGEWSGELVQTCRNGSRMIVVVRHVLQPGLGAEPHAVMESVLDVTVPQQTQADWRELDRDLEHRVVQEGVTREAVQTRAAHAERLQALGQLAGGIAHDFNNILQVVAGSAALIERRPGDVKATQRIVRRIIDSADRGAAITRRMLIFARRGKLEAEAIDPAALLEGLREICQFTLGAGIEVRVEAATDLPWLFADQGQLETALVNLATNARDAMSNSGILILSAERDVVTSAGNHPAALQAGSYIRLTVSDNGMGMGDDVLARVGEPFFTTKASGEGTGLGISMVRAFAEQSGGGFSISSQPEAGTIVSLWLPQADNVVAFRPAGVVRQDSLPGTAGRVLLVEDDRLVRETLAAQLEAECYSVVSASGGEQALSLLRTAAPFDMLVADLAMPGMNGLLLIQEAQRLRPRLPAILLTGYAEDGVTLGFSEAMTGTYLLIRKPVSGTELADRIAIALEPVVYAV